MNKSATSKNIYIVGASIGGLVAASVLSDSGCKVTIIEKGKQVGGLYSNIDTPFGKQELGMHVLYLTPEIFKHLCAIFGEESFDTLTGVNVDLGGSYNFGESYFKSVYPSLLDHPSRNDILQEILSGDKPTNSLNAYEAAVQRFGQICADTVFVPILEKVWGVPAQTLTPEALHCYMDLRRLVICEKPEADRFKKDKYLDDVIANPDQKDPAGEIYHGRIAVIFKSDAGDLNQKVANWVESKGIDLQFQKNIKVSDSEITLDDVVINEVADACIVTVPLHNFAQPDVDTLDTCELSIYYFKTDLDTALDFPTYYLLCHDAKLLSSRIVNFDAYHPDRPLDEKGVLGIEVIHKCGEAPAIDTIARELNGVIPGINILQAYKFPHSLKLCVPSLGNLNVLGNLEQNIATLFGSKPIYFTGMRTDTGLFFSHQTVGKAYDAAVECNKKLA